MGKLGKLLPISPTRSIYIEDQDGELIKKAEELKAAANKL